MLCCLLFFLLLSINWDVVSSPGLLREVLVAWKSTRDGLLNRNDSAKCIGPSSSALKATGCPCSHTTAFPSWRGIPRGRCEQCMCSSCWQFAHAGQECVHPNFNLENSPSILSCLYCDLQGNLYRRKQALAHNLCHGSCLHSFRVPKWQEFSENTCAQNQLCTTCGFECCSDTIRFSRFTWSDTWAFLALGTGAHVTACSVCGWPLTGAQWGVFHTCSFKEVEWCETGREVDGSYRMRPGGEKSSAVSVG